MTKEKYLELLQLKFEYEIELEEEGWYYAYFLVPVGLSFKEWESIDRSFDKHVEELVNDYLPGWTIYNGSDNTLREGMECRGCIISEPDAVESLIEPMCKLLDVNFPNWEQEAHDDMCDSGHPIIYQPKLDYDHAPATPKKVRADFGDEAVMDWVAWASYNLAERFKEREERHAKQSKARQISAYRRPSNR